MIQGWADCLSHSKYDGDGIAGLNSVSFGGRVADQILSFHGQHVKSHCRHEMFWVWRPRGSRIMNTTCMCQVLAAKNQQLFSCSCALVFDSDVGTSLQVLSDSDHHCLVDIVPCLRH